MNYRPERLESLIQREFSGILAKEMEFGGLVTIVSTSVSRNLAEAKIGVSVFPSERVGEALKILNGRRPHFQRLLAERVRIKSLPKIFFEINRGPEKAAEIEELLIKEESKE